VDVGHGSIVTGNDVTKSSGDKGEKEGLFMKGTFQSRVLASISAAVLALLIGATTPAVAADKKPNIVVIMGDDIGMWNIGATTAA